MGTVVAGTATGILIGDRLSERVRETVFHSLGLVTLLIGLLGIKSLLDGFASVAFASALGWGVGFSALVVLLYQGALTLSASWAAGVLSDAMVAAMTAAGGVLILGIGLRLLELRDIRVANLLPALILAPISIAVVERIG